MLQRLKQYIVIPLVFILMALQPAILGGCTLKLCKPKPTPAPPDTSKIFFGSPAQPINLVIWYVYDTPEVMNTLASQYKALHEFVTITPIQYPSLGKFEEQLGLKSGTEEAPDIYFIRYDWLPLYYLKLAPMPDKLLNYDPNGPDAAASLEEYLDLFFPALKDDMVKITTTTNAQTKETTTKSELYGLPWGHEGLALFVNTDHFNEYNKANPGDMINVPLPTETMTWNDFAEAANKLIKTTSGWAKVSGTNNSWTTEMNLNQVERFGAAIGNSFNVQHSTDIFTTMLMQTNINVVSDDHTTVEFIKGSNITAAVEALQSYTDFNKVWNKDWTSSVEAFAQNKVSMAFGRSYQLQGLQSIGSLHFEVVPFPQRSLDPSTWVTPTYYWPKVVNKDSQYVDVAWDFIRFVATKERMKVYSEITKLPPARLDLITEADLGSEKYRIFAQALPYTRTWFKGNYEDAEKAINDAINNVATKKTDAQAALTQAANQLEQILEEYPL